MCHFLCSVLYNFKTLSISMNTYAHIQIYVFKMAIAFKYTAEVDGFWINIWTYLSASFFLIVLYFIPLCGSLVVSNTLYSHNIVCSVFEVGCHPVNKMWVGETWIIFRRKLGHSITLQIGIQTIWLDPVLLPQTPTFLDSYKYYLCTISNSIISLIMELVLLLPTVRVYKIVTIDTLTFVSYIFVPRADFMWSQFW